MQFLEAVFIRPTVEEKRVCNGWVLNTVHMGLANWLCLLMREIDSLEQPSEMDVSKLLRSILGSVESSSELRIKRFYARSSESVERFLPTLSPAQMTYAGDESVTMPASPHSTKFFGYHPADPLFGSLFEVFEPILKPVQGKVPGRRSHRCGSQ